MSFENINRIEIPTKRFLLRSLTVEDVSARYLTWLGNSDARRYIVSAAKTKEVADLERYVADRQDRDDVLFLGIFDQQTKLHIGNIKFEPLNRKLGFAVMGILIGDPDYRGKGVSSEVLSVCAKWLKAHRGINQILLGVDKDNRAAIKAYEKTGFIVERTPHIKDVTPGAMTMVWHL